MLHGWCVQKSHHISLLVLTLDRLKRSLWLSQQFLLAFCAELSFLRVSWRKVQLYIRERRPRNAIQLCCTTNRFPTSHCFYSICRAHLIPVPVLSAMKHVGISSGSSLPRLRAVLQDPTCASGIQGPPPAASKQHAGKAGTGLASNT